MQYLYAISLPHTMFLAYLHAIHCDMLYAFFYRCYMLYLHATSLLHAIFYLQYRCCMVYFTLEITPPI